MGRERAASAKGTVLDDGRDHASGWSGVLRTDLPYVEARLTLRPLWERPCDVPIEQGGGGHGGGDERLLAGLFGPAAPDPLGRAATLVDGARAVLVGAAANQSFATGLPVRIADVTGDDTF